MELMEFRGLDSGRCGFGRIDAGERARGQGRSKDDVVPRLLSDFFRCRGPTWLHFRFVISVGSLNSRFGLLVSWVDDELAGNPRNEVGES